VTKNGLRRQRKTTLSAFEFGADIEAKNIFLRMTPQLWASSRGHVQDVKELMEHGADTEANDDDGRTHLHWACIKGHVAVVNELLSPNDSDGATTSILSKRKSLRADTEAKNAHGDTPLHSASVKCHPAVANALLSDGADILVINNDGGLPIHLAVRVEKIRSGQVSTSTALVRKNPSSPSTRAIESPHVDWQSQQY
jgi:ankyrin repeat protein